MSATYDFREIEAKWQAYWRQNRVFSMQPGNNKPKYYILDMFPYPSGSGLHVGHPLGYIATDIIARHRRNKGYNVLHPMGFDAFGLPAEQYAIQAGVHPAASTQQNIGNFLRQLGLMGLGYTPEATFRTSDPAYYKWTQWVFLQLFNAWYNKAANRAEPISTLEAHFAQHGTEGLQAATHQPGHFSADDWGAFPRDEQLRILSAHRLAYTSETLVNWCQALGTVLANDEVINGLSERGGHPVERRPMRQWSLRITAYAERLLAGLEGLDWPKSVVEMQKNWVGKSRGANVCFRLEGMPERLEIFTTRPDTIFGATFLVMAPEHAHMPHLIAHAQAQNPALAAQVSAYVQYATTRSERERLADAKVATGAFTGAYALHPFTHARIPVWTSEYVLAGYGTGAIMAVPAHDARDHAFARHFGLPIVEVVLGGPNVQAAPYESKDETALLTNSGFLTGLAVPEAANRAILELEGLGLGIGTTQYRMRDAIFSRQRYWGAPIPIVYDPQTGIPHGVPEAELPVLLPDLADFSPTGTGESPLARAAEWRTLPGGRLRELDTMPGWACSSWYFFRYPDADNPNRFSDAGKLEYWLPVDLYLGGAEHAVGHLLYARFWTKVLFDLGFVPVDEPFRKLVNQGMIQGMSALAYRHKATHEYVSADLIEKSAIDDYSAIHVDVNLVEGGQLDVERLRNWLPDFAQATFKTNAEGKFAVGSLAEKMSKRYHNVVNPDDVCAQFGADTFRMYEMFLGPLELSKPWNTDGITGVHAFLKRLWNLFYDNAEWALSDEAPTKPELRALHQTIRKVSEDIENLSFNTSVAQFMICLNDLQKLGCRKRAILEPLLVLLSPFAPHIAEELWHRAGHKASILDASWPHFNPEHLLQDVVNYPVQVNGKVRAQVELPAHLDSDAIEKAVCEGEELRKHLEGLTIRKVIVVPGRIVNVVAN